MDLEKSDLEGPKVDRRTSIKLFAAAGVMGAAGLAGCTGGGDQEENPGDSGGAADTATDESGDTAASESSSKRMGGSIEVGWLIDELVDLDPHYVDLGGQIQVHANVFNGLVKLDPSNQIVGDLASDWSIPDPTTYVFQLHDGVTFHNGDTLDAAAAKASLNRLKNADDSPHTSKAGVIDSMEASGTELTINLAQPTSPFLTFLVRGPGRAGTIVNTNAIEEMGAGEYTRNPVGSGPFQVGDRATGESLTLEKFDDYWETDDEGNSYPYLDEITIRLIPEASTMWSAVQAGSIVYTSAITGEFANQAENMNNLDVQASSSGDWECVTYLCNDPAEHKDWARYAGGFDEITTKWQDRDLPTSNKEVRRALSAAIDREEIVEKGYFGYAETAHTLYNPAIGWLYEALGGDEPDPGQYYDPEQAQQLLEEAGYGDGFSATLLGDASADKRILTILQQQFSDVGVDIELNLQQPSSYWDTLGRFTEMMGLYGGAADIDPWMSHWRQLGTPQKHPNMGVWQNPLYSNDEFDQLIAEDFQTPKIEDRKELLTQAWAILHEDSPFGMTVFPLTPKVSSTNLHDVGVQAGLSNFHYAWIEQ